MALLDDMRPELAGLLREIERQQETAACAVLSHGAKFGLLSLRRAGFIKAAPAKSGWRAILTPTGIDALHPPLPVKSGWQGQEALF